MPCGVKKAEYECPNPYLRDKWKRISWEELRDESVENKGKVVD